MKRLLQFVILLTVLAWCVPAHAAVTLTQALCKKTQAAAATITCTLASNVTGSNFVSVGINSDNGGDTVTGVTGFGSEAYTRSAHSPAGAGQSWIFYKFSATGGATTITATFGTHVGSQYIWVREWSGVGTGSLNTDLAGTATGATINTPSITNTAGDLLYVVCQFGGTINSIGSPWHADDSPTNIQNGESDEYILSGSGSSTATNFGTTGSNTWHCMGASFTPSGGGAAAVTPMNKLRRYERLDE